MGSNPTLSAIHRPPTPPIHTLCLLEGISMSDDKLAIDEARRAGHTLLLPVVIAIISYALLHLGINALLRMIAHRKTEI